MSLIGFLGSALPADETQRWSVQQLRALSGLSAPEALFGRREALARADVHQQWAQWFIQGIADPFRYFEAGLGYAHIFSDSLAAITRTFPALTRDERLDLSRLVANKILDTVAELRGEQERGSLDREARLLLLELAGLQPRCWICGLPFVTEAIDAFIDQSGNGAIVLPDFIDALKPIGLFKRDLSIEIDHIHPFSRGGSDSFENLRLACGWCNRHKGAAVSLYDTEGRLRQAAAKGTSFVSLPQPFWVVRILATQRRCEHIEGCSHCAEDSELTVTTTAGSGAPTPTNLRVTCAAHDPLRATRLLPRKTAASLWGVSP
ncbi:HNH endonuclease [Paraburkholderia caledonica]|uniref:HNH endonuclease n=1 Tax=Paraburkholderia caledonica TaxID=134536 RepID=UPI000DEFC642|nr:hypothetical protein CUJ87_00025 [Paraburkholderia caledonica]